MRVALEILAGLAAYVGLMLLVARCMAFGMGTLPAKTPRQIVLDVFDGKRV